MSERSERRERERKIEGRAEKRLSREDAITYIYIKRARVKERERERKREREKKRENKRENETH